MGAKTLLENTKPPVADDARAVPNNKLAQRVLCHHKNRFCGDQAIFV